MTSTAVGRLGVRSQRPLYQAARARLLQGLARGDYQPGQALPAEKELAASLGISIGTLRRAVDELVADGVLIRQQGRGTFVANHDRERLLYYFFHIVAHNGGKGQPAVALQGFERARADADAAARLGIAEQSPVWRIRNVQSLQGVPVIVDDITLAAARFPRLTRARVLGRPSTLYHLYQHDFGLTIVRTSERLRAVTAPDDVAALLRLPRGAPVLLIRRVALSYHDEPIEWRVSHVNTAAHEYFSELGS